MQDQIQVSSSAQESALATNKVLRNTYALLSMTLICSAITATMAPSLSTMVRTRVHKLSC